MASAPTPDRVVELAANLDDVTAELVGEAARTLLAEGALDVWTTPIQMKKQRPGVMLSVLAREAEARPTAVRMMQLTGSFGVRHRGWERTVLTREIVELPTRYGAVQIKVGRWEGAVVAATPEFEVCRRLAEAHGTAVRRVMEAARAAAERWLQDHAEAR